MTEADLPPTDPEFHESGQSPQPATGSHFRGFSQVQDAKLSGAEMRGSLLHSADFLDAVGLTVRQVSEAEVDERTRWPTYLREEMSK